MQKHSTRRRAFAALAVGFAMVAAACGGSDSGTASEEPEGNVIGVAKEDLKPTETTEGPTKVEPKSMEEWEKLWAEERAAIVKNIKDNKYGKNAAGTAIVGAEGFNVDLSKCESGWSDTEGITDTSVKFGQSIAQSGTLADYGNYGKSMDVLFKYYSGKGLFKDSTGKTRSIEYVQKDDGYDANRAISNVDELLDSEKAFLVWTLGSPATLKTYDKINKRCVPQPFAMTGHPAWGDPVNHPWTSGAPVASYTTEALFWGDFVESKFDEFGKDKITVAALVMNNDFGKVYIQGFKEFINSSEKLKGKVDLVEEIIEPQAPTITDTMTTLASKQPDIFIAMTAGTSCTQAITEAAANGMKDTTKYLIQPNTCGGVSFIGKDKVGGDGQAGNGWLIFEGGLKEIKDPAMFEDPWIKFLRGELQKAGLNPDSSTLLGHGAAYGWLGVQVTAIAGELDGGLTRSNWLTAMRHMNMTPPTHFWGIKSAMSGAKDSYISEAAVLSQFDATKQLWVPQGEVVDLNGKSKNCAWDQSAGVCK